jgi:predicted DCC family thiol-disulfide oxidoreductase YuxK
MDIAVNSTVNIVTNSGAKKVDKKSTEIQIFYNSACPVCDAGISAQKDKMVACAIQWRDVHADAKSCDEVSADLEFVRERLHAIDENGNVKVGIDAFELIWKHSPKEYWKARLIALPIIKPLSIFTYNIFAKFLYRWNLRKGHWKINP